jgi:hypothetical protein
MTESDLHELKHEGVPLNTLVYYGSTDYTPMVRPRNSGETTTIPRNMATAVAFSIELDTNLEIFWSSNGMLKTKQI